MNYKIFQICFEPRQMELVESPLTPFDNTANERPELREYHSFVKAIENGSTADLDAWGFFGPRWEAKLKYSAKDVGEAIDDNPSHDVWIFNHARVVNALTYNVWEQGEYFHKGLRRVAEEAFKIAGYDTSALNAFMTEHNTCYCSYFVARKEFWQDYIEFLNNILSALNELPEDVKAIYESSANYVRDSNLNMFPFLIERLFSTFLVLRHDKYKVHAMSPDYSVYSNQIGDFTRTLHSLNVLKNQVVEQDSEILFNAWNAIRMHFVKNNSELFNLD
jgi:hypothetical protein